MSTPPDSSAIDDVEFNILNEYYSYLKQFDISEVSESLDKITLSTNIKTVLCSSVSGIKKKSDLAIQILEHLYTNEYIIDNDNKLSNLIASNLDKNFFERLLKIFQSDDQMLSLKIVKILLCLLRTVLHQNLSIVNPLLQIMELGFKHSSYEIKVDTYNCWAGLISNFALDRTFFLKSKKFNLILTPLINKCKAYKDENLSKTKANAWLCLIENINEKLPEYTLKTLLPFFNYCFGIVDKSLDLIESGQKLPKNIELTMIDHSFDSLIQIGFELFVSLIHNGYLKQLDSSIRRNFRYVNEDKYYKIKSSLSNTSTWMYLLKYFFVVILKKASLNQSLVIQTWKKLYELLKLTSCDYSESRKVLTDEMTAEEADYDEKEFNELAEYFLRNSIEYVNNYQVSNKNQDKWFISQVIKHLLIALRSKGNKYLFENEKFIKNLLAMFKKSASLILTSDEENMNVYLNNLNALLILMEVQPALIDLYNWLHLSARTYDHLKNSKAKNSNVTLARVNYETLHSLMMFPFKNFIRLKIQESDVKVVINSLSNTAKSFSALIKQERIQIDHGQTQGGSVSNEEFNVNSWCVELFVDLKLNFDSLLEHGDFTPENRVKILYMQAQFNLYLLQNAFEFELINQLTENQAYSKELFQVEMSMGKKDDNYMSFSSLVDLIQNLTSGLYNVILNSDFSQKNSAVKKDYCDSPSLIENKQPIQIFCSLVDLISILFTRVKSHGILSKFLTNLAVSIEYISELNSVSKVSSNSVSSPATKKASRLSQMNQSYHQNQPIANINFQSTRHSNDLYDKLSMQIASYIQNHLTKSYLNHQFDSELLRTMEPIFYSFLKYSQKLNLKQKTLQAWNSTFGKSTVGSLVYSKRLEQLFVEIRDEMQNNTSRNSTGASQLIALSLPGFKLIDSLQSTNLTNSFMHEDYMMNDEKENTPENSNTDSKKNDTEKKILGMSKSKDFLNEASCSSVPVALLVTSNKNNENNNKESPSFAAQLKTTPVIENNKKFESLSMSVPKNKKQNDLLKEIQKNNSNSVNFCFSSVSGVSSSTSKLNSLMRTPDASSLGVRSSPRSLKNNNSKRKLDLNVLIDQMPDKDFIEINDKTNKIKERDLNNIMNKLDKSTEKKKNQFKQPLTEHQKEVRRKKSFIPMEIQSVCCILEPTMDSQMSCTNDTYPEDSLPQPQLAIAKNLKFDDEKMEAEVIEMDHSEKAEVNKFAAETVAEPAKNSDVMSEVSATNEESQNFSKNEMEISTNESPVITSKDKDYKDDEDHMIANMSSHILNAEKTTNLETENQFVQSNNFDEPSGSSSSNSPSKLSAINFKSKIKPNKKIELVEVRNNNQTTTEEIEKTSKTELLQETVAKVVEQEPVQEENQEINETENAAIELEKISEKKLPPEPETPNTRRRSSRLNKSRTETLAETKTEALEKSTRTAVNDKFADPLVEPTLNISTEMNSEKISENVVDLADQIEVNIDSSNEIDQDQILNQLNEDCKMTKMNVKSLRSVRRKLINSKKAVDVMGINHKFGKSKVVKSTFKAQQEKLKLAKKQKKYKKLIKGIKHNQKPGSKEKKAEKKALLDELNRSLNEEMIEDNTTKSEAKEFKENIADSIVEEMNKKTDVYEFEDVKPESEESSDDDMPISSMVKKDSKASIIPSFNLDDQSEVKSQGAESREGPVKKAEFKIKLDDIAEDNAPSTPVAKLNNSVSILGKSMNTSALTGAELIQKANGTPTTSILKKRLIESKVNHSATKKTINISSSALFAEENTPNKRRVSFCESVRIEEIEPNFNKSLFRSTPKPQNRAKLVFSSSHLNNKQSSISSSNNNSSTVNAILSNPTSNIGSSSQNSQQYEPKLNCSLNSATSNMSPKLSNSLNSLASQFKLNSNRLSICEASLPSNNMPANSNNSPSLNTPMSPGSSSLINSFLNNKQSFLSQRSSIIQQQMVQNQRNIPQNRSISGPSLSASSANSQLNTSLPGMKINSTPLIEQSKRDTETKMTEKMPQELYPKLTSCSVQLEKVGIEPDFQKQWLLNNWVKILKLKEITTVGQLCSVNSIDINNLPFKTPKLENFMSFIKKFETLNESPNPTSFHKQAIKLGTIMGSVEEEMDKLESNNDLDTSIESETTNDEKNFKKDTSNAKMNTPVPTKNKTPIDNIEMEVDISLVRSEEKSQKENSQFENIVTNIKSYVNDVNQSSFQVGEDLDTSSAMNVLSQIDSIESEVISEFQRKMSRILESRKKARLYIENLINLKK